MERETKSLQRHSPRLTSIPQRYRPGSELWYDDGDDEDDDGDAHQSLLDSGSRIPLVRTSSKSAARRQPRRTAGGGPPSERRLPPAGAVAEVIREKVPTRVQSRRRQPPYPVPSNGPPSAPATDTAPRSKRKKAPAPLKP
ncbi:unnamed protein product [Pleuronectes platessa]|uniref:Uncharacterized protein n=1 Tax=Pleuronectes platessa TaxID=8262 RepID=A0A9N7U6N2_PLEPL|nr:unnamed protein product [Pleuronectes platessa]